MRGATTGASRADKRLSVRRVREPQPELLVELEDYEREAFGRLGLRTCDLAVVAKAGLLLLAYVDDELVGGCQLLRMVDEPRSLYMVGFYLRPVWQGRKLGGEFLLAVLKEAEEVGADSVLLTVAPENERALALYRGAGFAHEVHVSDFYGKGEHRHVLRWRSGQEGLRGSV